MATSETGSAAGTTERTGIIADTAATRGGVVRVETGSLRIVKGGRSSANTADTTGLYDFIDTDAHLFPARFYRALTP